MKAVQANWQDLPKGTLFIESKTRYWTNIFRVLERTKSGVKLFGSTEPANLYRNVLVIVVSESIFGELNQGHQFVSTPLAQSPSGIRAPDDILTKTRPGYAKSMSDPEQNEFKINGHEPVLDFRHTFKFETKVVATLNV